MSNFIKGASAEMVARSIGHFTRAGSDYRVPAPGHDTSNRALSLRTRGDGLIWHCFSGEVDEAVRAYILAHVSGELFDGGSRDREPSGAERQRKMLARAHGLWNEAAPLTGHCIASRYLQARHVWTPGLTKRESLRFHPGIPFEGRKRPAMVAKIVHAYGGDMIGLHVTLLTPEATKDTSTSLDGGRMVLGKTKGGGVWPIAYDVEIVIAEGIESALAAELQLGVPAVAALSAIGLPTIYLPFAIRHVHIVADRDVSGVGKRKAIEAAARFSSLGKSAQVLLPEYDGQDANDLMGKGGELLPVESTRKGAPINDARTYGDGMVTIACLALDQEVLHLNDIKADEPGGRSVSYLSAFIKLCRLATDRLRIETYDLQDGSGLSCTILLYPGDVLANDRFLANLLGTNRHATRHFFDRLVQSGLVSKRRPRDPSGYVIRNRNVPDVIEMPGMMIAPVGLNISHYTENEHGSSAQKPTEIHADPISHFCPHPISAENNALSWGYEVVKPTITHTQNDQIAREREREAQWKVISTVGSVDVEGEIRAPRLPSWTLVLPPPLEAMDFHAKPKALLADQRAAWREVQGRLPEPDEQLLKRKTRGRKPKAPMNGGRR